MDLYRPLDQAAASITWSSHSESVTQTTMIASMLVAAGECVIKGTSIPLCINFVTWLNHLELTKNNWSFQTILTRRQNCLLGGMLVALTEKSTSWDTMYIDKNVIQNGKEVCFPSVCIEGIPNWNTWIDIINSAGARHLIFLWIA